MIGDEEDNKNGGKQGKFQEYKNVKTEEKQNTLMKRIKLQQKE